MKTIIIFLMISSALFSAQFSRDDVSDTVSDSKNQLIWQDVQLYSADLKTWSAAIDYCEGLDFAGSTSWRVPNQKELLSILDYGKTTKTTESTFLNTTSAYYWTSTTYSYRTDRVYAIIFNGALTYSRLKTDTAYVRCIRDN